MTVPDHVWAAVMAWLAAGAALQLARTFFVLLTAIERPGDCCKRRPAAKGGSQ